MKKSGSFIIILMVILLVSSACKQSPSPTASENATTTTTQPVSSETFTLQRPPVDEYVKVSGPLTIGEPPTPPQTDPYNGYATYIPYDSIIYHWSDNITEVFGSNGKRILIAKDNEATQVPTPAGVIAPATKILQVPNGASLDNGGDPSKGNLKVYLDSDLILTVITSPDPYPRQ